MKTMHGHDPGYATRIRRNGTFRKVWREIFSRGLNLLFVRVDQFGDRGDTGQFRRGPDEDFLVGVGELAQIAEDLRDI